MQQTKKQTAGTAQQHQTGDQHTALALHTSLPFIKKAIKQKNTVHFHRSQCRFVLQMHICCKKQNLQKKKKNALMTFFYPTKTPIYQSEILSGTCRKNKKIMGGGDIQTHQQQ